ncbi:MAG TPA: response regulator, partial [Anaerolineae bacterium]|nr:response regulator [Anaerolineae bacterium]
MKKFLIAHPDHFTQRAIEVTLRDLHHNTAVAHDGLDAIDQALDDPPDAIILGTNLPGLNGVDVARAFRALSTTKQIPILFITSDAADTAEVKQAGLSLIDWVQLPLDLTRVRDQVTRLIDTSAVSAAGQSFNLDRALSAISDPLTGLYARHYMLHRLAYEAARATR